MTATRQRAECPVCRADEAHELGPLLVCRCARCGVEFRPPCFSPPRVRRLAQVDLAGIVGEALGAAAYESLRAMLLALWGLVQLLLAFALIAVIVYFALRSTSNL